MNRKPALRHYAEYAFLRVVEWLVCPLPRRLTVCLAGWLGRVLMLTGVRRRQVEEQLAIAFGPAAPGDARRARLVHAVYQNTVLTFLEILQHAVLRRDIVAGIEREHVVAPLLQTGPILMVTGHIGNWEAFGVLLADYKVRGAMLAKPIHNPLLQQRIVQQRTALNGAELILTGDSMKAVVEAVHQGKCVGFVADQDAGRNGLFVDFFGCPASTARGPAQFAITLGIPLVPMFLVRDTTPERRLVLHVGEPLFPNQAADRKAEVRRLTEAHTRQLEDAVRQHPADYFWLHRRWKTRPETGPQAVDLAALRSLNAGELAGDC